MSQQPATVDVVIVNYRGVNDTLEALGRLGTWDRGCIFIVDNSAHMPDQMQDSARLKQVCDDHPGRRYISPMENLGFGNACNLAFAQSQAPFFLLLNPDAYISPADIDTLMETLRTQSELAAVSPKTFWNSEKTWVLPKPFGQTPWHTLAMAWASRWPRAMQWAAKWAVRRTQRQMSGPSPFAVDFMAGAVLLLRRSAVVYSGGLFDPRFFMFFEDADLSVRLRRRGYKLALVPQAEAVHTYRHKAFKADMMATSHDQYLQKHHAWFYRHRMQLLRIQKPLSHSPFLATNAQAFSQQTGGAPVLAWSPSPQMMPALVRPNRAVTGGFSEKEWALLEPGHYTALLGHSAVSATPEHWIYFVKV